MAFVTPVMEHWLEWEIAQWVHHEGSIRRPIAPWANALTTALHLAPDQFEVHLDLACGCQAVDRLVVYAHCCNTIQNLTPIVMATNIYEITQICFPVCIGLCTNSLTASLIQTSPNGFSFRPHACQTLAYFMQWVRCNWQKGIQTSMSWWLPITDCGSTVHTLEH